MNESDFFYFTYICVNYIDAIFSIIVAIIFLYLFINKRKAISSIYQVLLNFSFQMSLQELNTNIDRLNDYDADNDKDRKYVINLLNDVVGQMKGNPVLSKKCKNILETLSKFTDNPNKLTDAKKRFAVSQLRETLRNINTQNFNEIVGEDIHE